MEEEVGPSLIFADGTQSIYLADMSGDGLTDLVRIRNGEVCYWPNLGYGRFGPKVTMDRAPVFDQPDQFSQQRIRLADIDGSGNNDIIYLGRDGARLYFNESGNAWSSPRPLPQFPRSDNLTSVSTVDLFGNGTACLVWSSPLPGDARAPVRYIDLMGGQKPHLLIRTSNNLGAETHLHYAPSTRFYLADKRSGRPWITRLPFPVHVVERVETFDRISRNRFVTRFAYHHGYFDAVEREFRGFGMVEQWDTEEFAALATDRAASAAANVDASSHVPPIHTKTWFHCGVFLHRDRVSNFFAGLLDGHDVGEYFREPGLTDDQARRQLLADTALPEGLTPDEAREACRALKGAMLRQEIYALDGTEKARVPYTATEQSFTVRLVQPRGGNRHAVFFTHPREGLTYHYERDPTDPRITHALTLEVDAYGNVLKEAALGYGRRAPDPRLAAEDQAQQARMIATYSEDGVTNAIDTDDDYRAPLPCESRTFELTGLTLSAGHHRFTPVQILQAGTRAAVIAYEQSPTAGVLQKRLIEHARTLFRRDDLTSALPLGELQSLALPFATYKLAFTPGLLTGVFGDRISDAMLETEGRYVRSEGEPGWWVPSGRVFFSPNGNDSPAQESSYARQHFFLPLRSRDPFHTDALDTESVATYDGYDLLLVGTRDAIGNVMSVTTTDDGGTTAIRNDYRVLQPYWMTDANGNRARVAFDALGMVAGTAVMGKPPPAPIEGDSLDGFAADLSDAAVAADLADPLAEPHALLQRATTRLVYDLFAYYRTKAQRDPQPVVVHSLARETHDSDPVPAGGLRIQQSFSYSDGFGREIQKKTRAEPGPVPQRDATGAISIDSDGRMLMTSSTADPRWVGSGWTVLNNKAKPVRQFEPFFTDRHRFEFDVRIGVGPVLFYDPAGRAVGALQANHTWQKVVFDPWRQESWDVNDTVLVDDPRNDPDVGDFFRRLPEGDFLPTWFAQRSGGALGPDEQSTAERTALHAATPRVAHADSLGRTFLTIAHNRFKRDGDDPDAAPTDAFHTTRIVLDVEGNEREVIDADDRALARYDYDVLGRRIHQAGMDSGQRWMLDDVTGQSLYMWDSRNHRFHTLYDALRRPTEFYFQQGTSRELLVGRSVFGETQPEPEARNQRGKIVTNFDQAGVVVSSAYDFKGNLLSSSQQSADEYKDTLDWSTGPVLQEETFVSSSTYDALNRPLSVTAPDHSVYRPAFNEANLLESMEVDLRGAPTATVFVAGIDYDARGQRVRIRYGNNVETRYSHDPLTLRLVHLSTARSSDGALLLDLRYTYDPGGNVTTIVDRAQQTIYFDNQRVNADNNFVYDAIYRLIAAEGREHIGQTSQPQTTADDRFRVRLPHPGDGQAMRRYAQEYRYDLAGNVLQLIHRAANANWTRDYTYDEPSLIEPDRKGNRLSRTIVGANGRDSYTHDAHGNMTSMPHLTLMRWDFKDQLKATARQAVNDATPETTYYVYDAAGQRARKITERENGTRKDERIYLGGFEVYREYDGTGTNITLERETLHVMDNKERIALVETKTLDAQSPAGSHPSLIRYQIGNHLGSVSLELDDSARIISYEEYYPYGSTSYQAVRSATEVSLKRYRYTGLERDEETGLGYHGARYYAPWLARWTAADPLGIKDGLNAFSSFHNSPVVFRDLNGRQNTPSNFVEYATSIEQGLNRIQQLGVQDNIEYGLAQDAATKKLLILRGTRTEIAFGKLTPLGHTHTGNDTTHGPSTADLNEFAGKKVEEHWIYGKENGWARLRYDPKTKTFDVLAQRGEHAARFTIFENPNFNPRDRSPLGQAARWRTSIDDIKGKFNVEPSSVAKPGAPGPTLLAEERAARAAGVAIAVLLAVVNAKDAKEAAAGVGIAVVASRIPEAALVTAKDEGEAGFGILMLHVATKFPLTATLIAVALGVYAGGMWLRPKKMTAPPIGPDQSWAKPWFEGGTRSGCGTCHETVRIDNAYKTNPLLRNWEELNGPASRNGIVTDSAREFYMQNAGF